MTTLAVSDIIRVRLACYTPTQAAFNVIHYRVTAVGGVVPTIAGAAERLAIIGASVYPAIMSAGARYRGASAQKIFPLPVSRSYAYTAADTPGLVAGDILPGQVAGIISTLTDFGGPKYRGRIYLPFPSEASNEATGNPDAAYGVNSFALAVALFQQIIVGTNPNTATLQPVLWHRGLNTYTNIVDAFNRDKWATQRRRGDYGRTNPIPF